MYSPVHPYASHWLLTSPTPPCLNPDMPQGHVSSNPLLFTHLCLWQGVWQLKRCTYPPVHTYASHWRFISPTPTLVLLESRHAPGSRQHESFTVHIRVSKASGLSVKEVNVLSCTSICITLATHIPHPALFESRHAPGSRQLESFTVHTLVSMARVWQLKRLHIPPCPYICITLAIHIPNPYPRLVGIQTRPWVTSARILYCSHTCVYGKGVSAKEVHIPPCPYICITLAIHIPTPIPSCWNPDTPLGHVSPNPLLFSMATSSF